MNAWVRQADAKGKAKFGYMTLVNVGSADVTLIQAESEAFAKIEVYEMAKINGLMKMREAPNVVIPAQGKIRFEPGGKHLMLMGPQAHFTTGHTVDITLTFRFGGKQSVSVKVADK